MKEQAKKELARMENVFSAIKINSHKDIHDFALNYFKDAKHFYEKEKYIEAFEAAVISWAYIDVGLKLDFFKIPKELRNSFTA